jgi:hypothetical protein
MENLNEKFDWVERFVFSTTLEKFVAIAGVEDELFLIDLDGKVVEHLENA